MEPSSQHSKAQRRRRKKNRGEENSARKKNDKDITPRATHRETHAKILGKTEHLRKMSNAGEGITYLARLETGGASKV